MVTIVRHYKFPDFKGKEVAFLQGMVKDKIVLGQKASVEVQYNHWYGKANKLLSVG